MSWPIIEMGNGEMGNGWQQAGLERGFILRAAQGPVNESRVEQTQSIEAAAFAGRQPAALFELLSETEEKLCPTGKPFLFQLSQLSF
jgi:hypothetical protein